MILPIEKQVCTAASAAHIQGLGVIYRTVWVWQYHLTAKKHFLKAYEKAIVAIYPFESMIPAYTCSEFGVLLPGGIETSAVIGIDKIRRYICKGQPKLDLKKVFIEEIPAEAQAKMFIHLLASGRIRP